MQREILNFCNLPHADDDNGDEVHDMGNAGNNESLNDDDLSHHRSNHQQMQTSADQNISDSREDREIGMIDNNHSNKRAKMERGRKYMSYTGKRIPRVGDDYQVVDLPRLVEDDHDLHTNDHEKAGKPNINRADSTAVTTSEISSSSGKVRSKKNSKSDIGSE